MELEEIFEIGAYHRRERRLALKRLLSLIL